MKTELKKKKEERKLFISSLSLLPLLVSHPARHRLSVSTPQTRLTSRVVIFFTEPPHPLGSRSSLQSWSMEGRMFDCLVKWTGGVPEFCFFCWVFSFFFLTFLFPSSPLGVSGGFGKDEISAVEIHDPVLQVEFPFGLTSVNL